MHFKSEKKKTFFYVLFRQPTQNEGSVTKNPFKFVKKCQPETVLPVKSEIHKKMHLAASEVSSTTNPTTMEHGGSVASSGASRSSSSSSSSSGGGTVSVGGDSVVDGSTAAAAAKHLPLTAETLAERTIDGLLADHPGELVRTGSPHVVSVSLTAVEFRTAKLEITSINRRFKQ